MGLLFDEDVDFGEEVIGLEQSTIEQTIASDPSMQVPIIREQPVPQPGVANATIDQQMAATQPESPSASQNTLQSQLYDFRSEVYTTQKGTTFSYEGGINNRNIAADTYGARLFAERLHYNIFIIQGPANPAFVDAQLTYRDIAWGYRLEYNSNGILWRVNAAGIVHPDDYANYLEQNRIIEAAYERTFTDIGKIALVSNNGNGNTTTQVNAKNVEKQTTENYDNQEVTYGPGRKINAAFSNAIYYDGVQRIPDGFRSIGAWRNPKTQFYAEFFTDGKQIVVVFRGTDSFKAIIESDRQLLFKRSVAQFADVKDTLKELKRIIADYPGLKELPISATGHSLGGACAQYFTYISGYPSETFGAPGIIGSLKAMGINIDNIGKQNFHVINIINKYDPVATAELEGHLGITLIYDMNTKNTIVWDDNALLAGNPSIDHSLTKEHSMNKYQSFVGDPHEAPADSPYTEPYHPPFLNTTLF